MQGWAESRMSSWAVVRMSLMSATLIGAFK